MSLAFDTIHKILHHNVGFEAPELWVDYALRHGFKRVTARKIPNCPDCGGNSKHRLGQYVYYSTLIHLEECDLCGLVWADAHLDPGVVRAHFEKAYKDDTYFAERRRQVFRHLTSLIDRCAPPGGRVIDVGGAKGHLRRPLALTRPDLHLVVHDISEAATKYVGERFRIPTICGDIRALQSRQVKYDVVVLSDVLYYEPHLATFWLLLPQLLSENGSVIIRVPNRLLCIRAGQQLAHFVRSTGRVLQDRVRFFNPEHIYILSRRYLTSRLTQLGFGHVRAFPSPLLSSDSPIGNSARWAFFHATTLLGVLSGGRLVLSPDMIIIGKKHGVDKTERAWGLTTA